MSQGKNPGPDRRNSSKNRRSGEQDRRNDDRMADDMLPRRSPDQPDRRQAR